MHVGVGRPFAGVLWCDANRVGPIAAFAGLNMIADNNRTAELLIKIVSTLIIPSLSGLKMNRRRATRRPVVVLVVAKRLQLRVGRRAARLLTYFETLSACASLACSAGVSCFLETMRPVLASTKISVTFFDPGRSISNDQTSFPASRSSSAL